MGQPASKQTWAAPRWPYKGRQGKPRGSSAAANGLFSQPTHGDAPSVFPFLVTLGQRWRRGGHELRGGGIRSRDHGAAHMAGTPVCGETFLAALPHFSLIRSFTHSFLHVSFPAAPPHTADRSLRPCDLLPVTEQRQRKQCRSGTRFRPQGRDFGMPVMRARLPAPESAQARAAAADGA